MRNQQLQAAPRSVTCKRIGLALTAVIAMLVVYFAPAAGSAEVVMKKQQLTAQQARLTDGEDLYDELCAVCHGMSGTGDGPAVAALKQDPVDLTVLRASNNGEFPREMLEESIYGSNRISAHGTLDMPVWGRAFAFTKPEWGRVKRNQFAKHQIHNIVDYIESLQVE